MVTIVIPCYNASLYIDKCLASLAKQTFKQFRVIVVDDKSTDGTYEYLLKIQEQSVLNIKILQNSKNSGAAASRNLGILSADTKYITFCDSDDWYDTDFLEKMVNLLETNNADIAFCGYKVVDERGNSKLRPVYDDKGVINRHKAFCLDADSLCMLMVKTDIMKNTLLPNLRNGEDMATIPLLIAKSHRYAVTNKCLYNYFRRSNSISETPTIEVIDALLYSFEYVKCNFPQKLRAELEYIGIKNVLYSTMIILFSINYNKKRAIKILRKFEYEFPNWRKNPYCKSLRAYKKMIIILLSIQCFWGIRIVALLRSKILK